MADSPAASARQRFAALAARPDAVLDLGDLEEGALLIAAEEYPDLRPEAVRQQLDELGRGAARRVAEAPDEGGRVERLLRYLFEEEGFTGARADYYDPRNSYLNDVLSRRRGIPITLALVTMTVARRAGLDARGIPFPGHFLVKCVAPPGPGAHPGPREWIVDAFAGRTLTRAECETRLAAALGEPVPLEPGVHLRDATPREILARMLTNLARIFAEEGDGERLLSCCDRLVLLTPGDPLALRDRATLYERLGWLAAAASDLDAALAVTVDPEQARELRARRDALRERQGPLH